MSGLGGILYFDRQQVVSDDILCSLDAGLSHLGPDGASSAVYPGVGFIYRAFNTTLEERRCPQPYKNRNSLVCFDGRIDNRPDLLRDLHINAGDDTLSDVEIVAAGYECWGKECFRRLQGDFGIALWDARSAVLYLVRDSFGVKRLFYHVDHKRIVWATVPDALLELEDVTMELDENYVALFLSHYPTAQMSPFRSITPVRPAHFVSVCNQRSTSQCYWDIHAISTNSRVESDQACVEEFRDKFLEAVRVRLRADTNVVAELSGGLDSSCIVCAADRVSQVTGGKVRPVETVSYVFDKAQHADERCFIRQVEEQRARPGIHIREDDDPIFSNWRDQSFISFPNTDLCYGGLIYQKLETLRKMDVRVLLSGMYGDQLLALDDVPYAAAAHVRAGRCISAFALCVEDALRIRRSAVELFWRFGIRPNLPVCMRPVRAHIPEWITPHFVRRTGLKELLRSVIEIPPGHFGGASRFHQLLAGIELMGSGYSENQTRLGSLEIRYPYLHRPLVEFVVSLPTDVVVRPGRNNRWLQRSAMSSLLPEMIAQRRGKTGPTEAIIIAVNREWGKLKQLIDNSRACHNGYVEAKAILADFEQLRNGISPHSDVLRFIALELWLRAIESWRRRKELLNVASMTSNRVNLP